MPRFPEALKARFQGAQGLRTGVVTYLAAALAVPFAVLARDALRGGWENFWNALTLPSAAAALRLSLWTAALVTVVNAAMGTLTAYALARFAFPGRRLMNALIDFPLAVPGLVTGAVLAVLYGPRGGGVGGLLSSAGIVLALLFLCLPLGVRSVQPLLLSADRDQEEAALALGAPPGAVFRRVVLPHLAPGIVAGALLTFSRSLGEAGALVWMAGNVPLKSQTAAVYILGEIESDNRLGASAMSVVLIGASFLLALGLGAWRARAAERRR